MTDLPEHLKRDASYIQCDKCGRKSRSEAVNSICGMKQPDGSRCTGHLRGLMPRSEGTTHG